MRKAIVKQHMEELLKEQESHGGELIMVVAYSDQQDQPNNAEGLTKASDLFVARTIQALAEAIQKDEEESWCPR